MGEIIIRQSQAGKPRQAWCFLLPPRHDAS
jgi:hypothetical protein